MVKRFTHTMSFRINSVAVQTEKTFGFFARLVTHTSNTRDGTRATL